MSPKTKVEALSKARRIKARFYKDNKDLYAIDIYYQLVKKYDLDRDLGLFSAVWIAIDGFQDHKNNLTVPELEKFVDRWTGIKHIHIASQYAASLDGMGIVRWAQV